MNIVWKYNQRRVFFYVQVIFNFHDGSVYVGMLRKGEKLGILVVIEWKISHPKLYTLPKTKSDFSLENRPGPKRKGSSSNHPFSGAMLVAGRVHLFVQTHQLLGVTMSDPTPAASSEPNQPETPAVSCFCINQVSSMTSNLTISSPAQNHNYAWASVPNSSSPINFHQHQ